MRDINHLPRVPRYHISNFNGLLSGTFCTAVTRTPALKTILEIRGGAVVLPHTTWKQKFLWVPRLWFRFQLSYLTGFPCIMGITLLYAHYIGFEAFNPS